MLGRLELDVQISLCQLLNRGLQIGNRRQCFMQRIPAIHTEHHQQQQQYQDSPTNIGQQLIMKQNKIKANRDETH